MASQLHRTSFLARLGGGAAIGALALVTGACSGDGAPDGDSGAASDARGETSAPAEPAADRDVPVIVEDAPQPEAATPPEDDAPAMTGETP